MAVAAKGTGGPSGAPNKRRRARRARKSRYDNDDDEDSSSSSSSSDSDSSSSADSPAKKAALIINKGKAKASESSAAQDSDDSSDSSDSDSSSSSSSSSDSESNSSDSSSDSDSSTASSSSEEFTLRKRGARRRRTRTGVDDPAPQPSAAPVPAQAHARSAQLPAQDPANASSSKPKRAPLPPQDVLAAEGAEAMLSRKEQKDLQRRRKLAEAQQRKAQRIADGLPPEAEGEEDEGEGEDGDDGTRRRKGKPRFTPSPTTSDDEEQTAQAHFGGMKPSLAARYALKMQQLHGRAFPSSSADAAEQRFWWLAPGTLPPLPPPSTNGAADVLGKELYDELVRKREAMRKRDVEAAARGNDGEVEASAAVEEGKAKEAREADAARRKDKFRDVWMREMAEQFGEELNSMRQREPALTDNPERLLLLIDSLRSGADLFRMRSGAPPAEKGKKKRNGDAQALDDLDEVDVVLEAQAKKQARSNGSAMDVDA